VTPDGTVLRGTATIAKAEPFDPAHPLALTDIAEEPAILPKR
jgi:hypothetical protein